MAVEDAARSSENRSRSSSAIPPHPPRRARPPPYRDGLVQIRDQLHLSASARHRIEHETYRQRRQERPAASTRWTGSPSDVEGAAEFMRRRLLEWGQGPLADPKKRLSVPQCPHS